MATIQPLHWSPGSQSRVPSNPLSSEHPEWFSSASQSASNLCGKPRTVPRSSGSPAPTATAVTRPSEWPSNMPTSSSLRSDVLCDNTASVPLASFRWKPSTKWQQTLAGYGKRLLFSSFNYCIRKLGQPCQKLFSPFNKVTVGTGVLCFWAFKTLWLETLFKFLNSLLFLSFPLILPQKGFGLASGNEVH